MTWLRSESLYLIECLSALCCSILAVNTWLYCLAMLSLVPHFLLVL